MIEVTLDDPENFLKIKETLTRIGIKSGNKLYQSCHILHKRGQYYIIHFKGLFQLDGRQVCITEDDMNREYNIACMLEDWNLLNIVSNTDEEPYFKDSSHITVIPYKDKHKWQLCPKYTIGKKKYHG
jgi:hypothetical protein